MGLRKLCEKFEGAHGSHPKGQARNIQLLREQLHTYSNVIDRHLPSFCGRNGNGRYELPHCKRGFIMDEAVVGKLATVLTLTVGMLVATWIIARLDSKRSRG
jgi:hypothetical protein